MIESKNRLFLLFFPLLNFDKTEKKGERVCGTRKQKKIVKNVK